MKKDLEIYEKIWELAKPYYKKGRPMDIDHIEWMIVDAELICERENLDESILLPLVILHDVGYGEISLKNPFDINTRKEHMREGGRVANKILKKLNYSSDKTKIISHLISIHDNWSLGDNKSYRENIILSTFNDLDFMWMATPKGFLTLMKMLDKNAKEMIEYLKSNEKLVNRPFSTKTTKQLFEKYLLDRKNELS